jgi:hypothetical protein
MAHGTAALRVYGAGLGMQHWLLFSKLWCGEVFCELGVRMFQLSLVLYLSQACLQLLSKVPGSWSSHGLQLYPSHHIGSSKYFLYDMSGGVSLLVLMVLCSVSLLRLYVHPFSRLGKFSTVMLLNKISMQLFVALLLLLYT